jgi:hypothetical protein
MWGYVNDPLIFVVNKDIWNSWTPADREIVKQAAIDAGKEEIAIARKGMVEADKPLLKEIAANGVTVTAAVGRRARSLRQGHPPRVRQVEEPDRRRSGDDLQPLLGDAGGLLLLAEQKGQEGHAAHFPPNRRLKKPGFSASMKRRGLSSPRKRSITSL